MEPLYPNPGGKVDPEDLVGRVSELQRLMEALSRGGAHVTGERRMGKTSLLAKLEAELEASGRPVIRISAETSNLDVFVNRLMRALRDQSLLQRRIARWEKEVEGSINLSVADSGVKLRGVARSKPDQVKELDLMDLLASAEGPAGTVLIIDEITVLCQHLGPANATEFLRALRVQRQSNRPVPLVVSGSIGLHHALPDTQVINDLWVVPVGALKEEEEACELVERLLLGIRLDHDDDLVADILEQTSQIPFYIHAIVDKLRDGTRSSISDLVDQAIDDDDWHTGHYVSRIGEYYGEADAELVRAMLDEFALAFPAALGLERLLQLPSIGGSAGVSRTRLLGLVDKLEKDHYLKRRDHADRMSSALLARIWRRHRRLL